MIDINAMIRKEIENGYGDTNAQSKVCQDLILKAISSSKFNRNVTIKGGVVMRSKTKNVRRATKDVDLDFIRYSLSNESIDSFVEHLNCLEGLKIERVGRITELKQQDYSGKRIFVRITDSNGFSIENKLDLGVHNRLNIQQEEFCFDIAYDDEGASLLINSNEQMFAEKLRSLLKWGVLSNRYKDIFDMYYLIQFVDKEKLKQCLDVYILDDPGMRENDLQDIYRRINMVFKDKMYRKNIDTRDANWLDENTDTVLKGIMEFLRKLEEYIDVTRQQKNLSQKKETNKRSLHS